MSSMHSTGMTYADLNDLPYHRHLRYELFDGELITHDTRTEKRSACRVLSFLLGMALKNRAPAVCGDYEWYVDDRNVYRPDALYRADWVAYHVQSLRGEEPVPVAPLPPVLAIDVLEAPSHAAEPRRLKAYARAGLPHYWVIDSTVPSITLFEQVAGTFVQKAVVKGDEILAVEEPFPVKLCPSGQLV